MRTFGGPSGAGSLVVALGVVFGLSGSSPLLSQDPGEPCAELLSRSPDSREAAECVHRSGSGASGEGGEPAAVRRLEALSRQHPESPWFAFYLANLLWADAEQAEELYARAAARFARQGAFEGEVQARGNRSQLLFRLGRTAEAAEQAELAYRVGESSQDPAVQAQGAMFLGRHLRQTGVELQRARALLADACSSDGLSSVPGALKTCLLSFGNVSLEIGRLREAHDAFSRLLELAEAEGDRWIEASARYGLVRVAAERAAEQPTSAARESVLGFARAALEAARAAGNDGIEVKTRWILGLLSPRDDAWVHLDACSRSASQARERGLCLNAVARRFGMTDPDAARDAIRTALALAEEAGDPFTKAFAWREKMRVGWAVEPLERAIADSWAALETIERLRDLQPDGSEVQAGLFSTWADDYHWFAGRLLEEARETGRRELVEEAFAVSERLRARALLDWLRAADPGSAAAAPREFAVLADVQGALRPGEALLAFQVAPWEDLAGDFGGGSWVIAVSRRTVRAHPLPGRRELRRAVELYTGLFEGRDGTEAAPSAHLYDRLLGPALAGLPDGVERLVVLPDDALHRLPFGALRASADVPPLATTHRLSVAPSATLWAAWRRAEGDPRLLAGAGADPGRPEPAKGSALVLAAPDLGEVGRGRPAIPAPGPVSPGSAEAPGSGGDRAAALPGAGLPPLRHALREGRTVASALESGGMEAAELVTGREASEALLRGADLSSFGVFHLATHAVADDSDSQASAVLLAPGEGEDGFLRPGEIVALDLHGSLVVLSSCRSAAGDVLRGEGVMSLARAFFQAGARTVVASLWPLRDDEAAVLFERFYRHMARGETAAGALRAAQGDRIAAGAPAHAWAGVIVLGDGDLAPVRAPAGPHPIEGGRVALTVAIGAGLILALLLMAFRRRLVAAVAGRFPVRTSPS